ncbi:transglycosylase family protein [Streptacidiphilus monticola]
MDPSGRYGGLYQFDVHTWHAVGGHGRPQDAPPDEQTARARTLYHLRGTSPGPPAAPARLVSPPRCGRQGRQGRGAVDTCGSATWARPAHHRGDPSPINGANLREWWAGCAHAAEPVVGCRARAVEPGWAAAPGRRSRTWATASRSWRLRRLSLRLGGRASGCR